jgi:hypothetical protein
MTDALNLNAIRSEIRLALINQKANACPMAARVAWHAAGTYDASDGSGGTDGATMRFEPEKSDPANAGLSIIRDMLHPVRVNHPELSEADLWGLAGAMAVEFLGGPAIPCAPFRIHPPAQPAVLPSTNSALIPLPDWAQLHLWAQGRRRWVSLPGKRPAA